MQRGSDCGPNRLLTLCISAKIGRLPPPNARHVIRHIGGVACCLHSVKCRHNQRHAKRHAMGSLLTVKTTDLLRAILDGATQNLGQNTRNILKRQCCRAGQRIAPPHMPKVAQNLGRAAATSQTSMKANRPFPAGTAICACMQRPARCTVPGLE